MKRKRVEEKKPKKNSLNVTLIVAVVALVAVVIIVLSFKLSKSIYLAPAPSPTPPSTCPVPDKRQDQMCPHIGTPPLPAQVRSTFGNAKQSALDTCETKLKELCETDQNNENEIFKNKCEKNEDPKYANVKCEHKSYPSIMPCSIIQCYIIEYWVRWTLGYEGIIWEVMKRTCKVDLNGNPSWLCALATQEVVAVYDTEAEANVNCPENEYECYAKWGKHDITLYSCNKALVASAGFSPPPSQLA